MPYKNEVPVCYVNLAHIYLNLGDIENSSLYAEKALNFLKSSFGEDNPLIAECYKILGTASYYKNDDDATLDYYIKALNMNITFYGENNPRVAADFTDIADVLFSARRFSEALEYYKKAEAIYGASGSGTVYNNIARAAVRGRREVREWVWADDQTIEEDFERGMTTLSFTSSQWIPALRWVLSFGAEAEPLAPDWFVADWKDAVRRMAERLGGSA